eukprot:1149345-Pelagomonas_calceolata.AAC.4
MHQLARSPKNFCARDQASKDTFAVVAAGAWAFCCVAFNEVPDIATLASCFEWAKVCIVLTLAFAFTLLPWHHFEQALQNMHCHMYAVSKIMPFGRSSGSKVMPLGYSLHQALQNMPRHM